MGVDTIEINLVNIWNYNATCICWKALWKLTFLLKYLSSYRRWYMCEVFSIMGEGPPTKGDAYCFFNWLQTKQNAIWYSLDFEKLNWFVSGLILDYKQ